MNEVVAFAGAVVALRLAGALARRWRARHAPELAAWAAALTCYALACAALAWGAAAGWDGRVFRVYYLFGGLLTAPLLGAGSLLLMRRIYVTVIAALYAGLAAGVAIAEPLTRSIARNGIPSAQDHFDFFPSRAVALIGNTIGTLAVVCVALLTIRRRPLANALVLAGVACSAVGSAFSRFGEGTTATLLTAGVVLLYAGFDSRRLANFSRGTEV
jgi:hypothetical protein